MGRQRIFLLLSVTVTAMAAAPALAQGVASATASGDVPDFSGVWSHPYIPGFEPPASGRGPVTNRSRIPGGPQKDVGNPSQLVGDCTNPILKPQAAEAVRKHGDNELRGVVSPNPANQCWPEGVPFVLSSVAMLMLQQPDKVIIHYADNQFFRQVWLNRPHPAQATPSWFGDSVGHYEGDTLVVDTVGVKTDRPFAMVDWYGTPYTESLHVVERYRLLDYEGAKEGLERNAKENLRLPPFAIPAGVDWDPNYRGKYLQLQFTVEDEGVFNMPWSATITYGRPINDGRGVEYICAENTHSSYAGKDTAVPRADKPDF